MHPTRTAFSLSLLSMILGKSASDPFQYLVCDADRPFAASNGRVIDPNKPTVVEMRLFYANACIAFDAAHCNTEKDICSAQISWKKGQADTLEWNYFYKKDNSDWVDILDCDELAYSVLDDSDTSEPDPECDGDSIKYCCKKIDTVTRDEFNKSHPNHDAIAIE